MLRVLMFLVPLALAIYALVDCISSKDDEVKHLPKLVWLLLIVFAWVIGPLAWIFIGRRRELPGRTPGVRGTARGGWVAPDDNPDFLKSINEDKLREENERDKELLESWEEDLRRREEEMRENDDDGGSSGSGPQDGTPPAKG
jgi:hypothetical protein